MAEEPTYELTAIVDSIEAALTQAGVTDRKILREAKYAGLERVLVGIEQAIHDSVPVSSIVQRIKDDDDSTHPIKDSRASQSIPRHRAAYVEKLAELEIAENIANTVFDGEIEPRILQAILMTSDRLSLSSTEQVRYR